MLDALEMLDGERIDPAGSRYAREVLNRLNAKGHGQVLNRNELVTGSTDVEYFSGQAPVSNPICWSSCWAYWPIPATSCSRSPATRSTRQARFAGRTLAR